MIRPEYCRADAAETVCLVHGGTLQAGTCPTRIVLDEVLEERRAQFARYGTNNDLEDGTGPETRWLAPLLPTPADFIELDLRVGYERDERNGTLTWMHLVREEVAESFKESDPVRLREELLQVAALAVSWIETLDHRASLEEK